MFSKLILNIAPAYEEELVDVLLSMDCVSGFTSLVVSGSGSHRHMSLAEQVTGRRKRVQFELILETADMDEALSQLCGQVPDDTVYHIEPVFRFGKLADLQKPGSV
jgi:hypothetical protein